MTSRPFDHWKHDWRVDPDLKTTTLIFPTQLKMLGIKNDPDSFSFRRFVANALRLEEIKHQGMIHTWTYSDGSIRATFQPSKD